MSIFAKNSENGEIWLRKPDNTIFSANSALSAIYQKYESINSNFFLNLSSNQIKKFDIIYDVIYLETAAGYSFDKFEIDEYENFAPINLNNNFQSYTTNTSNDFWFDDQTNRIYSFFGGLSGNTFHYRVDVYDSIKNTYSKKLEFTFDVGDVNVDVLEPMVVCYNDSTQTFNITSIFRYYNIETNIVSINIIKKKSLEVNAINIISPVFNIGIIGTEDLSVIYTENLDIITFD